MSGIAVRAQEMTPEEIVAVYDAADASLAPLIAKQDLLLELRRRVAEWKFTLLSGRDLRFNQLARLHADIVALGFSTLEKEITMGILFARICRRFDEKTRFNECVDKLNARLDREARNGENDVIRDLKRCVDAISREE